MKIPKVVLDTNVFVSAILLKGSSALIMEKWRQGKFVLLISADIFEEYFEVIARPKFKQKEEDIKELAALLTEKAVAVEPRIRIKEIEADPEDDKFLECAVAGRADFIVSGDHHLLDIGDYRGIKILSLADFFRKEDSF